MSDPRRRKVLVCRGKYGDYYYAGDTPEEIAKNALAILTERWNAGHWYETPDVDRIHKDLVMAGVSDEEIDAHSSEYERGTVRATREWARGNVSRDAEDQRWFNEAQRAVENQDPTLALRLLELRNDHEYEEVVIEPLLGCDEA